MSYPAHNQICLIVLKMSPPPQKAFRFFNVAQGPEEEINGKMSLESSAGLVVL